MNCSDVRFVYWDLPFFGRNEARYRLEPFRDNVRFLGCDCRLFWEFWLFLAAWDSFPESQSATCWDVLFHQSRFTLGFCDASSKLLFRSLRSGTLLKNFRVADYNLLAKIPGSAKGSRFWTHTKWQIIQFFFNQIFLCIETFIGWKTCYL